MSRLLTQLRFDARPDMLRQVRERVRECVAELGVDEPLAGKLVLVADEACANVIRHGYKGRHDGEIILRMVDDDGCLEFYIRDYAEPVDPGAAQPRDLSECRPGGLGMAFIDAVMDDWEFRRPENGEGNILYMNKHIRNG